MNRGKIKKLVIDSREARWKADEILDGGEIRPSRLFSKDDKVRAKAERLYDEYKRLYAKGEKLERQAGELVVEAVKNGEIDVEYNSFGHSYTVRLDDVKFTIRERDLVDKIFSLRL